jgi:hypothetical protein
MRCLVPLCPHEAVGYCLDHGVEYRCACGAAYRFPAEGFRRAKTAHEASSWHRAFTERQWALANGVAR